MSCGCNLLFSCLFTFTLNQISTVSKNLKSFVIKTQFTSVSFPMELINLSQHYYCWCKIPQNPLLHKNNVSRSVLVKYKRYSPILLRTVRTKHSAVN